MVLRPRNGISLCAGAGGLELGLQLAEPSFACRCFVEADPDAQAVLVAGMAPPELDGLPRANATSGLRDGDPAMVANPTGRYAQPFHTAAMWSDVRTFVGDAWRGHIDLVSAGYPCQPFSAAGKRAGSDDERHLWPDVARIYSETGAEWGFFENVAGHISLGLETVLRDLWDMGATPAVGLFSSGETGNTHERQRVFIVAHRQGTDRRREQQSRSAGRGRARPTGSRAELADTNGGHTSPKRQQRGGEQRFQPQSRRHGEGAVGDTGHPRRGPESTTGHQPNRDDAGREKANGRFGKPDAPMGHAAGIGRGEGWPEPEVRSGRNPSAGNGRELAHPGQPGPQGREQPGSPDQWNGALASGSTAQRGRPYLCPPGPADHAAWGHVLRMAPDLAPSIAFRDLIDRAKDMAAMVAEGRVAEAQAVAHLRFSLDAMANRPRQLKVLGNGVDPLTAAYAWQTLSRAHGLGSHDFTNRRL